MADAAQSIPHQSVNVQQLDVDFLAFSGHKMCGPTGTGVLYGKRELLDSMEGFIVGGDTVEYTTYTDYQHLPLPEKFEAGLQDYAGIIGLGAAVDYLTSVGFDFIHAQEHKLNIAITEGLADISRLHLLGPADPSLRAGIVAFHVEGADYHQIALLLDESYRIMVRSGQHCVHSWFNHCDLQGSVRASLYFYNTEEEAARFVRAVHEIVDIL
jgi:cysteine desulfurase/selenocysteine lyase